MGPVLAAVVVTEIEHRARCEIPRERPISEASSWGPLPNLSILHENLENQPLDTPLASLS